MKNVRAEKDEGEERFKCIECRYDEMLDETPPPQISLMQTNVYVMSEQSTNFHEYLISKLYITWGDLFVFAQGTRDRKKSNKTKRTSVLCDKRMFVREYFSSETIDPHYVTHLF